MLTDSHTHLNAEQFNEDQEKLFSEHWMPELQEWSMLALTGRPYRVQLSLLRSMISSILRWLASCRCD